MTVIHMDAMGVVAQITLDWSVNVSNVITGAATASTAIFGLWRVLLRLTLLERAQEVESKRGDRHGERIDEMIEAIGELKGIALASRRDIDRLDGRNDHYREMGAHGS